MTDIIKTVKNYKTHNNSFGVLMPKIGDVRRKRFPMEYKPSDAKILVLDEQGLPAFIEKYKLQQWNGKEWVETDNQ